MSKVTMLKSGIKGLANAVNRFAVKDKKFAEELVFMHGLKTDITPKSLQKIGLTKDMFDKGGKLTKKGKNEVTRLIKELNLPQNATWNQALEAIGRSKDSLPELPKLEIPKFKI